MLYNINMYIYTHYNSYTDPYKIRRGIHNFHFLDEKT